MQSIEQKYDWYYLILTENKGNLPNSGCYILYTNMYK